MGLPRFVLITVFARVIPRNFSFLLLLSVDRAGEYLVAGNQLFRKGLTEVPRLGRSRIAFKLGTPQSSRFICDPYPLHRPNYPLAVLLREVRRSSVQYVS